MYPFKIIQKLDYTNSIKHKNRGPPPRFSPNLMYPPQKSLKMTFLFKKKNTFLNGSQFLVMENFDQRLNNQCDRFGTKIK
jgi:hypothetical protein